MNSRIVLAGLAATALVALTACNGPTTGEARPAQDTSSASLPAGTAPPSTSSPTSTKAGTSLEDIQPCSLLTKSEAEQVTGAQREEPAPEKVGSSRTCGFSPKGKSFTVGIRTNAGLSGVQAPGEVTDRTIGRHQAKKFVASGGSCIVAIGVTASSRVDISLNAGGVEDPCPLAERIAELVEPRLP
ncbi:MAG: DUF3558 domain-containing protein [Umezawaea sp.]